MIHNEAQQARQEGATLEEQDVVSTKDQQQSDDDVKKQQPQKQEQQQVQKQQHEQQDTLPQAASLDKAKMWAAILIAMAKACTTMTGHVFVAPITLAKATARFGIRAVLFVLKFAFRLIVRMWFGSNAPTTEDEDETVEKIVTASAATTETSVPLSITHDHVVPTILAKDITIERETFDTDAIAHSTLHANVARDEETEMNLLMCEITLKKEAIVSGMNDQQHSDVSRTDDVEKISSKQNATAIENSEHLQQTLDAHVSKSLELAREIGATETKVVDDWEELIENISEIITSSAVIGMPSPVASIDIPTSTVTASPKKGKCQKRANKQQRDTAPLVVANRDAVRKAYAAMRYSTTSLPSKSAVSQ